MTKSVPMLDLNESPSPEDLIYAVKDTGLPDRDRKLTLLGLLQAYLSDSFESLGTLDWDAGQPITHVPAWRSQYPSGDLEQGWLNLREVLDPVSSVGLAWNITSENPTVALGSYTQSIRVAVSGNSETTRTYTLTGTPRAGQEIWFFVGTANLTTPATIKHGTDTLATIKGGELVRVHTVGTALVAEVVAGAKNLGRASDLTWLTGPLLEEWFTGLGWEDAETPGWTGAQLLTVLNAFGPTYQAAAASAAAAKLLSKELSGPFGAEAVWGNTGIVDQVSDDDAIVGRPCRAVRVRGHVVDTSSNVTDAALSLEMGISAAYMNDSPVLVKLVATAGANDPLFAFLLALTHLQPGAHGLEVPCTFSATSKTRIGRAFISVLASGLSTITAQITFTLDLLDGAVLTWNALDGVFPGAIKLSMHTTFTIPAPPAA